MAIVDDNYILKLEQLRIKLIGILRSKEMIVDENETLDNLIPMVDKISNLKGFEDYLFDNLETYENNNIENIPNAYMFYGLKQLHKIKMDNLISANTNFCQLASGITNINFNKLNTIKAYSFYGTNIVNAIFPNVTEIKNGEHVLSYCPRLKRIIVPNLQSGFSGTMLLSVSTVELIDAGQQSSIGFNGNYGTTGVKILILRKSNTIATLRNANYITNLEEVYVPQALLETYKTATNWSVYADKFKPLEGSKYESLTWYESEDWYAEEMSVWQ